MAWGVFLLEVQTLFENHSTYDMAAMQALVRVSARKIFRWWRLRRVVLTTSGVVAMVCGALLLGVFRFLDTTERLLCGISLLIGMIAFLKGLLFYKLIAQKLWRDLLRAGDTMERRYIFRETAFQGIRINSETCYAYEAIRAAYETPGYYFLFLDSGNSALLDKGGFIEGSASGFRTFLEKKLGGTLEFVG